MIRLTKPLAYLGALLVTCAIADAATAQCTEDIHAIVSHDMGTGKLTPGSEEGNIVAESCKTWPYKPDLTLAAIAYDAGVESQKSLVVAVIDSKKNRVVSSYRTEIAEDALVETGSGSLQLDTARYQLTDNIRAFGIRFISAARWPSCGEARWGDELTLFIPEKSTLKPVLSLNRYVQKSLQGCLGVQDPTAIRLDADLTLAMAATRTNGFRDLRVTAAITVNTNGEAADHVDTGSKHYLLRYDGKHYRGNGPAPWWIDLALMH